MENEGSSGMDFTFSHFKTNEHLRPIFVQGCFGVVVVFVCVVCFFKRNSNLRQGMKNLDDKCFWSPARVPLKP